MSSSAGSAATDPVVAARRELHELTVLSSALLRLATKVQARCDALRHTLGDIGPLDDAEVDRHAPRGVDAPEPAPVADGEADADAGDDQDPAALLAMSLADEGMSREQIAEYLQESFGMQETDVLLDQVLPAAAGSEAEPPAKA